MRYEGLIAHRCRQLGVMSRQLGHSAASFTLDVYGGLFDRRELARRPSDGLEAAFSAVLDPDLAGRAAVLRRACVSSARSLILTRCRA